MQLPTTDSGLIAELQLCVPDVWSKAQEYKNLALDKDFEPGNLNHHSYNLLEKPTVLAVPLQWHDFDQPRTYASLEDYNGTVYSSVLQLGNDPESVEQNYFLYKERFQEIRKRWRHLDCSVEKADLNELIRETDVMIERMGKVAMGLMTDHMTAPVLGGEYLRNLVFTRLRTSSEPGVKPEDIYSAAMVMPMTYWNNTLGKTAASVMKEILFYVARSFFTQKFDDDSTPDNYLERVDVGDLIFVPHDDPEIGRVTIVNKTILAIQQASPEMMRKFLELLPELTSRFIVALIAKQHILNPVAEVMTLGYDPMGLMPVDDYARFERDLRKWQRISHLASQFEYDDTGLKVIARDEKGLIVGRHDLNQAGLDRLSVGIAKYDGSEDLPIHADKKRIRSHVYIKVDQLRDAAITSAENIFSIVNGNGSDKIDLDERISDLGLSTGTRKIFWREGRYLTKRTISLQLKSVMRKVEQDSLVSTDDSDRQYRPMNDKDLVKALTGVAMHQLCADKKYVAETSGEDLQGNAEKIADKWLHALKIEAHITARQRKSRIQQDHVVEDFRELIKACHDAFLSSVPDMRVRALYYELGGTVDPRRDLREFFSTKGENAVRAMLAEYRDGKRQLDEHRGVDRTLLERMQNIKKLYHHAARDQQNGLTFQRRIFPVMVQRHIHQYYDKLDKNKVMPQGEIRKVFYIGFEAKNAKTVDGSGNPLTPYDLGDKNMVLLKRVPHQAMAKARAIWLKEMGGTGFIADDFPILTYAMGDEIVLAVPGHLPNGKEIANDHLRLLADLIRKELWKKIPFVLHYETKITLEKSAIRPKLYKVVNKDNGGDIAVIAAMAGDLEDSPRDTEIWVVEEEGKSLEKPKKMKLGDFQNYRITSYTGLIDCRLVAFSQNLSSRGHLQSYVHGAGGPEERRLIDLAVDHVIDLDELLKLYVKANNVNPIKQRIMAEQGIYIYLGNDDANGGAPFVQV